MFENELKDKLKSIFLVSEVSFDQPSEVKEQDKLWVDISDMKQTVKDGKVEGRIIGKAYMYGQSSKLTLGFFIQRIIKADSSLTKDFFFENLDSNTKYYQNLVERGFDFVYFFSGQYDPDIGTITRVEFI